MKRDTGTDRGQAITLEGFLASMIVLMAILLALQSVVITPTTGGAVDRTVQSQLQQEAKDSLVVAETLTTEEASQDEREFGDLNRMVRYWNTSANHFHGAEQPISGEDYNTYNATVFEDVDISEDGNDFGQILNDRFTTQGWNYNVVIVFQDDDEYESREVVYQGQPNPNAYTASYTVTLFEDQRLLEEDGDEKSDSLTDVSHPDEYIIPNEGSGEVYNVVEVRLTVW